MSSLIERFDQLIPQEFQRQTVRCLFQAYRESYVILRNSGDHYLLHDNLGHFRRAKFNELWRTMTNARFPHIDCHTVPNSNHCCFHTKVEIPGQLIWTPARLGSPGSKLPESITRTEYILLTPQQTNLFEEELDLSGECIFAVLLHNGDSDIKASPSFGLVGFPSLEGGFFNFIDLFERFPGEVNNSHEETVRVMEEFKIRLRRMDQEQTGIA